jgi:predicted phosphodiesterase
MHSIHIYGDIHGKYLDFQKKIEENKSERIIQIGDLGLEYSYLNHLDPMFFKFFQGNHDCYDKNCKTDHMLGDYGLVNFWDLEFFFIRGEFSIDQHERKKIMTNTSNKIWWVDEELNKGEMKKALKIYKKEKPKIVMSHGCPTEIARKIGSSYVLKMFGFDPKNFTTNTQELLQSCFDSNRPNVWIFGHMHQNLDFYHRGTRFICIDELCHIQYKDGDFINKNKLDRRY